jgi:hypothetical protein
MQRCDLHQIRVHDYTKTNPEQITINLREGGYCDRYILPLAWNYYFGQKSQNPGDYASLWCNGSPNPGPVRPDSVAYMADANTYAQGGDFHNCHQPGENTDDFYVQGRGTILLSRTVVRPEYAAQATASAGEKAEPIYRLTPTEPAGGNSQGYVIVIDQCYRSGEKVQCWGKVTNTTDASTTMTLHGGHAVDDEGNSFPIGMGQFDFSADVPLGDSVQRLLPNVPTKVFIIVTDGHLNARKLTLSLRTGWEGGGYARYDDHIFNDVPIQ